MTNHKKHHPANTRLSPSPHLSSDDAGQSISTLKLQIHADAKCFHIWIGCGVGVRFGIYACVRGYHKKVLCVDVKLRFREHAPQPGCGEVIPKRNILQAHERSILQEKVSGAIR